jgi:hypothetical protein
VNEMRPSAAVAINWIVLQRSFCVGKQQQQVSYAGGLDLGIFLFRFDIWTREFGMDGANAAGTGGCSEAANKPQPLADQQATTHHAIQPNENNE